MKSPSLNRGKWTETHQQGLGGSQGPTKDLTSVPVKSWKEIKEERDDDRRMDGQMDGRTDGQR